MTAVGLAVVAAVVILTWVIGDSGDDATVGASSSRSTSQSASAAEAPSSQVPQRVTRTLALIDAGQWPEAAHASGTRGGIAFRNSERRLPATDSAGKRIAYQEWDVNPKKPGQSRDAERIVTGSDGSAWYTANHYQTFARIRGPNQ